MNSISDKVEVWEQELANDSDRKFLIEGIKHGFRISNVEHYSEVKQVEVSNHSSALNNSDLVEEELVEQIKLGNYVKTKVPPKVISPIGAILKNEQEVRIIHDGSRPTGDAMNDYSTLHSEHYQTIDEAYTLAKPYYFLSKVDLKSAYRSVSISSKDYCLTGLKWQFKGDQSPTYLFDTRLPFGASLAPMTFHRLTQSVRRMMWNRGFTNIVVYLDDFLIIEESYERCLEAQHTLISLLIKLGFRISWHKVLGPSRVVPFLGIVIDTNDCSLSLDEGKLSKLESQLLCFKEKKRATKRQLQQLAGLLNWACQAVRGGRYFLRRILDTISRLKKGSHKTKLSKAFKLDIEWWLQFLRSFNGVVYYREAAAFVVHTDACLQGAGMFCSGDWCYINWKCDDKRHSQMHINYKEVLAVVWSAKRWATKWTNANVTVFTDSTVAKAIINKGTCKSPLVMNSLRDLFWLSVKYNFKLHAVHIPGQLNMLPDTISRLHEPGQVLHLQSLLSSWHHCAYSLDLSAHMSFAALQVIPSLRQMRVVSESS